MTMGRHVVIPMGATPPIVNPVMALTSLALPSCASSWSSMSRKVMLFYEGWQQLREWRISWCVLVDC